MTCPRCQKDHARRPHHDDHEDSVVGDHLDQRPPWQERQPGVRTRSIWEHPESKRRAVMTRIEPDAKLPLHRHVGDELVFVIEGASRTSSAR